MRKILFRGKRADNKEWCFGDLLQVPSKNFCSIIEQKSLATNRTVKAETVGQYTGLTDKNGKKIYEGDIVKHFNNCGDDYDIGEIYYDTEFVGWRRTTNGKFHNKTLILTYKLNPNCIYEVIGNIHDNPELLKEGVK